MTNKPDYTLSDRQKSFIRKAEREGYEIRYNYSGRGMFGRCCPAVVHERGDFGFRGASQDSMGLKVVTYMER